MYQNPAINLLSPDLVRYHFKILVNKLLLILLVFITIHPPSIAEIVSLEINSGLIAQADYRPGDSNKPTILLLHGFLQTYQFSIIQSISNELSDNGYTILAPTLTMGINKRSQSMTCDMIQSHTFGDHHKELDNWINWLKKKGHDEIILIGHSTGALRLISYTSQKNAQRNNITRVILISPTMPGATNKPAVLKNNLDTAHSLIQKGNAEPNKFSLAYCSENYISSAEAYISYASLTENKFFDYLKKTDIPLAVILGNNDKLIPQNWYNQLKQAGANITPIEGANHFYSNGNEFDLFDAINGIIEQ
ncbi:MAG: alpha/beta fold hydrolase [Gammaproteobacteria bacterium]|nr:alpha/beta fold hydrolase [Gammaproteobacteria bacterium]MCW8910322.1 alpha/beta fold hydrolase [Gammaproteobacteria bacterium]MCW9006125.1 alpha/beta fold hydrolase [Gammaproteobacteria bacterium]MCW9055754.1 alpha/beta fold hydrolase [Gammaproteobacteria bacterium]